MVAPWLSSDIDDPCHTTSSTGSTADQPPYRICACSARHHHRLIHHSEWEVEISPDGLPRFTAPHWVTPDIATANPTWRVMIAETFPRRRTAA